MTPSRPRYRRLQQVAFSLRVVLSVLARECGREPAAAFAAAARELELPGLEPLAPDQVSVAAFSKAVHTLADCFPLLKPRVLKAMTLVAGHDGALTPGEREIIYSVAAVMDCPLPTEGDWPLTATDRPAAS